MKSGSGGFLRPVNFVILKSVLNLRHLTLWVSLNWSHWIFDSCLMLNKLCYLSVFYNPESQFHLSRLFQYFGIKFRPYKYKDCGVLRAGLVVDYRLV